MPSDKTYVKLWISYEAYFEALSDAEVGRLARAMIEYKSSGVEPKFSGNERFIWPAIRRDIDEAEERERIFAEKQAENGARGGRPKNPEKPKEPNPFSENPKKPTLFSETQKSQGLRTMDKGQRTKDEREKAPSEPERESAFEAFWRAYPRKAGKQAAKKAWDKLRPDTALVEKIMRAIEEQKHSRQWQEGGGQFIPYPATWLNGGHYDNEPIETDQERNRSYSRDELQELGYFDLPEGM